MIVVFAVLALPIWPVRLASDIWPEDEFLTRKSEFENLAQNFSGEYYNQFMDEESKLLDGVTDEDFERLDEEYRYQINMRYGTVSGRRSLLFGTFSKRESLTTYAFASHIKRGLPYFEYEEEGWRAYLTPAGLKKIVEQVGPDQPPTRPEFE